MLFRSPQLVYNILLWAREDAVGKPPPSSVSAAHGIALDPGQGAIVERLDAPGQWTVAPGRSVLTGVPPGVYRVLDRRGERLVALTHPREEHGRVGTGEQVAEPAEASLDVVERPRLVWFAMAAMVLLLAEFLVAVR